MKTNSNSITNSSFKYGTVADWVYVYRQYIPDKVLASDLEVELTINDDGTERTQIVKLYDIIRMANSNQEIVAIPRYCPFANTLYLQNKVLDYTTNGADIDISIKVPPRNHYQQEAINAMLSNEHGIISCKTAFGKTYCAINAICQLKKRALILMHKRELMKQWKEDFLKYTDLTEDDIQIFTGDKFQSGKAVTITTVQNICAKIRSHNFANREAFNNENFGITIFDECHTTVGPLANTQASRWCFSKRIYGLSATPERGDGLDKVINYIIGNVIYKDNRKLLPVFVSFSPVALHIPQKTCYYLTRSTMQYHIGYIFLMRDCGVKTLMVTFGLIIIAFLSFVVALCFWIQSMLDATGKLEREEAKKKVENKYGLVTFDEEKEDAEYFYFICKQIAPSFIIKVNKKTGRLKREKPFDLNIISRKKHSFL